MCKPNALSVIKTQNGEKENTQNGVENSSAFSKIYSTSTYYMILLSTVLASRLSFATHSAGRSMLLSSSSSWRIHVYFREKQ